MAKWSLFNWKRPKSVGGGTPSDYNEVKQQVNINKETIDNLTTWAETANWLHEGYDDRIKANKAAIDSNNAKLKCYLVPTLITIHFSKKITDTIYEYWYESSDPTSTIHIISYTRECLRDAGYLGQFASITFSVYNNLMRLETSEVWDTPENLTCLEVFIIERGFNNG